MIAKLLKHLIFYFLKILLIITRLIQFKERVYYDLVLLKLDGGYGDYYIFSKYLENFQISDNIRILIISTYNSKEFLSKYECQIDIWYLNFHAIKFIKSAIKYLKLTSKINSKLMINLTLKSDVFRADFYFEKIEAIKKIKYTFESKFKTKTNKDIFYSENILQNFDAAFDYLVEEKLLVKNETYNRFDVFKKNSEIIIINEICRDPKRTLSKVQWQKIIFHILENSNYEIFIYSDDKNIIHDRVKYCDPISFEQLKKNINRSKLVISPESFVSHVAAFEGTDSIVLCGGGHYGKFIPYSKSNVVKIKEPEYLTNYLNCFGCNWNCLFNDKTYRCVNIDIRNIFIKIDELLNET